jgi:hypothetical protein
LADQSASMLNHEWQRSIIPSFSPHPTGILLEVLNSCAAGWIGRIPRGQPFRIKFPDFFPRRSIRSVNQAQSQVPILEDDWPRNF